jgi:hypothetical protein
MRSLSIEAFPWQLGKAILGLGLLILRPMRFLLALNSHFAAGVGMQPLRKCSWLVRASLETLVLMVTFTVRLTGKAVNVRRAAHAPEERPHSVQRQPEVRA